MDGEPGALHGDLCWVAAAGAHSGVAVDDKDPWNALYPAAPPMGIVSGEVIASSDSRTMLLLGASMLMVAAAVVRRCELARADVHVNEHKSQR